MATSNTVKIALSALTFTLHQGVHTTKGHAIYVAAPSGRTSKDDFKTVAELSNANKGSYAQNAYFTSGATPDGYTFKTVEERTAFAKLNKGTTPVAEPAKAKKPTAKKLAAMVAQVAVTPVAEFHKPTAADSRMYVLDDTVGVRLATMTEVMAAFKAMLPR